MSKNLKRPLDDLNDTNSKVDASNKKHKTELSQNEIESLLLDYDLLNVLPPSNQILRNDYGTPKKSLIIQEPDAGVLGYMDSSISSIKAIVKHRFTDFFVNEIDEDNNVIVLTDIGLPVDLIADEKKKARDEANALKVNEWPKDVDEEVINVVGNDVCRQLKEFVIEGPVDNKFVYTDVIEDKDKRSTVHQMIRDVFGGRFETTSVENHSIQVKWVKNGRPKQRQSKSDKDLQFIHFILQKSNRDSSDALNHLTKLLKLNSKQISVAGTKDKRGVTTQRIAIKRGGMTLQDVWRRINNCGSEDLKLKKKVRRTDDEAVRERGERGCRIGNLNYEDNKLELGMLNGNRFGIVLRDVECESEDDINKSLKVLSQRGFINYFGMQRFGTSAIPTHYTGWLLLKGDWEGAVHSIIRMKAGEGEESEKGRRVWFEEKNGKKALDLMPRRMVAERAIIGWLSKKNCERDYLGALSKIPKNLRTMYVHAYQSYIWNSIVSERIKMFGAQKVVTGDLVKIDNKENDDDIREVKEGEENKYTIFDVVMTLPGKDVIYPKGKLREKYEEMLRMDGLEIDKLWRAQRDFSMEGSYRKMIHLPKEVKWEIIKYKGEDEPLMRSKEDELIGLEEYYDKSMNNEKEDKLGIKLEFNLGSSAYATMAIREVLKGEEKRIHS